MLEIPVSFGSGKNVSSFRIAREGDGTMYFYYVKVDSLVVLPSPANLNLVGVAGENEFTVSWGSVSDATGYTVTLLDALGGTVDTQSRTPLETTATFSGLTSSTAYTVSVVAIGDHTATDDSAPKTLEVETAASSIAIVIPPSIAFVVYASITGVSVGEMFMSGIVPGIMMGLALIVIVVIEVHKKGIVASRERASWGERLKSFGSAFWGLMVPVIILGGIYGGIFTPTEAAAVSVVYALLVGLFIYREVKWKQLVKILVDSGKTTGGIMLIIGAATLFSFVCTKHGISKAAQALLLNVAGNKYVFLLTVNIIFLIAGCFVDANSAMYIFIPIMYPVATKLGIDPIHFGIIATVNLAIGQVTPPVGVNLFVAIGISDRMKGLRDKTKVTIASMSAAVWPMIISCVVALLLITYVPWFSLFILGR